MFRAYHVDRLGDQLSAGMTIRLLHTDDLRNNHDSISKYIVAHWSDGLSRSGLQYLLRNHQPATKDSEAIHFDPSTVLEIVAELVRKSRYPHLPSRFQSFYAFDQVGEAKQFADAYPADPLNASGHKAVVWEVEAREDGFRGDMRWLRTGDSLLHLLVNVENYWSGVASDTPQWELLLRPPITVLRQVSLAWI